MTVVNFPKKIVVSHILMDTAEVGTGRHNKTLKEEEMLRQRFASNGNLILGQAGLDAYFK